MGEEDVWDTPRPDVPSGSHRRISSVRELTTADPAHASDPDRPDRTVPKRTATMSWEFCEDLAMVVHGRVDPSDEEWNACLDDLTAFQRRRGKLPKLLVFSDGAHPNSLQRQKTTDLGHRTSLHVAIVSRSPLVRGVVTMLSWFGTHARAFSDDTELPKALEFLESDPSLATHVRGRIKHLRGMLGSPRSTFPPENDERD